MKKSRVKRCSTTYKDILSEIPPKVLLCDCRSVCTRLLHTSPLHDGHLRLCLELFPPRSVHASAPWPFEKHWPFTAAADRRWWSAWRVVVRQVGLISLWASLCCATLQEILLWACRTPIQALTFLGWGKEKHQLSWRDPWRMRTHYFLPLGGGGGVL